MFQHPQDIAQLYREHGHVAYEGEGITQLLHGWQCGQLAKRALASPPLQLAAWLHDVGHLTSGLSGTPTLAGIDDRHEHAGAQLVRGLFGDAVAQPIALHVAAKRHLVARQAGYRESLSQDSIRSLALQGGPFNDHECEAFEALPYARDALRVRVWDDTAKNADWLPTSDEAALAELEALMREVAAHP